LKELLNFKYKFEVLKEKIVQFYSSDPKTSQDFGRIVNKFHTKRICKYIDEVN